MKIGCSVFFGGLVILLAHGQYAQTTNEKVEKMIQVIQKFSLNFLQKVILYREEKMQHVNEMISPFSVWTMLIMLYHGAKGKTLEQLRDVLGITVDDDELKEFYDDTREFRDADSSEMEIRSWQKLYHSKNYLIEYEYKNVTYYYDMGPERKDFEHQVGYINDDIRAATNDYIHATIQRNQIAGAKILLLSAIYFMGKWKHPFNEKLTKVEPFYNETSPYKLIAKVPMMVQIAKFAYVDEIKGLDARVLELPYGTEDTLAMLVMLPNRGSTVKDVVNNLKKLGLLPILDALKNRTSAKDDVEVKIPKLNTYSAYILPKFLYQIGLKDVVNSDKANLKGMSVGPSSYRMSLSHSLHFSRIIMDEMGTPGATPKPERSNKTGVVEFHMNKPFVYLVVQKEMKLILFAGAVRNKDKK
ncbi:serine protease inhibitor 77Ba-like [Drosophila subpulchrella]|uniref:serine protease inhibitor 77Ba-like n=1 Tax=Drosophila subpulchrella TaxID=1486046 RepID=UPI0018A14596|nr:serine protease inhibitor 77Ba-like [Drosophila subpulchrella]